MPFPDLALRAGLAGIALAAAESGRQPLKGSELRRVAEALAIPVGLLEQVAAPTLRAEGDEKAGGLEVSEVGTRPDE
jgi:hypothetical protein